MQEAEERLCEIRRTTSGREVKVNEMEMALNLKKQELNKAQKENDLSTSVLKKEADDINHRLANLTAQEHVSHILLDFQPFLFVQYVVYCYMLLIFDYRKLRLLGMSWR